MIQLSIIIINFNTPDLTLACIQSIRQFCSELNYEIIVVDNAPLTDNEALFRHKVPDLVYLRSEANIGFGGANNLGMKRAMGDYFLLLNSDTLLIDNSLEKCYRFMEDSNNAHIGLLGCKLLNEDGSYQHSFYPFTKDSVWNYFKSNNPLLYKICRVQKKFKEVHHTRIVGDVSGAFMWLRRSVVEKVKGFDPDFFLYCEETEWCRLRISRHFDICYYPESRIIHLGGKSAPKKIMYLQSQLSLALYWYKRSLTAYVGYITLSWVNGLYYALTYPFGSRGSKQAIGQYLYALWKVFPYLFHDIPRFSRAFGSREEGLVLTEAKKIFFRQKP